MIHHDFIDPIATRMVPDHGSLTHFSLGTAFRFRQAGIGSSASEEGGTTLVWEICLLASLRTDSSVAEYRSVPAGVASQQRGGINEHAYRHEGKPNRWGFLEHGTHEKMRTRLL
jgi:hypothetical protein